MPDSLLSIIYKNEDDLFSSVKECIDRGEDLNLITKYQESPLRIASNNGRFDVVKLLLDNGADESQLGWTEIFPVIAFGSVKDLENLVSKGCDLEVRDFGCRTPYLFAILVGDLNKIEVLVNTGADTEALGFRDKTPIDFATQKDNSLVLEWLISNGEDPEHSDEYQYTPLMLAVQKNAVKCIKILIENGVDIFKTNHVQEQAITMAVSEEVVDILVAAGADINDMSKEMRVETLGYQVEGKPDISRVEFLKGRKRVFGKSNPELSSNSFWKAMVRCGGTAYHASSLFDEKKDSFWDDPVWSYDRFGMSITKLEDGRYIEIAGEHEDHYDPDFCIYNDVFVHKGNGEFDIYIYPRDVFPPTDFHTATLVDRKIYIIGNLGYREDRKPGYTQVYCLDVETLEIKRVETKGEMPGWISRHKACFDGQSSILIKGGKLIVNENGKEGYIDNHEEFCLCIKTLEWQKVKKNQN